MRICVFGAGAIGSWLAARLAATGAEASIVGRGPHLVAIRDRGLVLHEGGQQHTLALDATDDPSTLGRQDAVVVTLKAHSILAALPAIEPLLGGDTAVVAAQNGIPWWYLHDLEGPWSDAPLESVDPGGVINRTLGVQRAVGCVVYPSCEVVEPGVIRHLDGERLMLGEPDGTRSTRVTELSALFTAAGLKAPVRQRIRDDLWLKLLGNLSFNPVSVLTGATLAELGAHGESLALIRALMAEAKTVAERFGTRFAVDLDRRLRWGVAVGHHKTSMLQDFEAGRPLELDAVVGAVRELGARVDVGTPRLDAISALVDLRWRLAAGVKPGS
jgi:2-dehydropantoate 2-reductase